MPIRTRSGRQVWGGATYRESLDSYGNAITVTDPESHQTIYTYNILGQIETKTTPEGDLFQYSYDDAGNLLRVEDPLHRVTTYDYDEAGNLKKVTLPNTASVEFTYNNLNELVGQKDAVGHSTRQLYDHKTRTFTFTDAMGHKSYIRTDALGRLEYLKDPNGNEISQTYENFLLTEVNYPTLKQTYEYNPSRWAEKINNSSTAPPKADRSAMTR